MPIPHRKGTNEEEGKNNGTNEEEGKNNACKHKKDLHGKFVSRCQCTNMTKNKQGLNQWRSQGAEGDGVSVPGFSSVPDFSLSVPIFGRSSMTELVNRSSIMELESLSILLLCTYCNSTV